MAVNRPFILLILLSLAVVATAQDKVIEAHRLKGQSIVLDGKLDEGFWLEITPSGGFLATEPVEGGEPSERTEIRIAYDAQNLYIGAILYDSDPSGIKAYQRKRDASLRTDDSFMWILDTFNDKRRAYFFEINPIALRGDGLLATGQGGGPGSRRINKDWDGIWIAKTHIGEFGWSAEIRIPFQTLNFNPEAEAWGINFQRTIRRYNEELMWTGHRRNQGLFRPQNAGQLTGLTELSQGVGLEVIPYGIVQSSKEFDSESSETTRDSKLNGGFDINYNVTPGLKASFTYNTDFAQTEVDDRQINLTRFPLRFPEKRDFFLEGSRVLQFAPSSGVDPYFSRRIGLLEGRPIPLRYGGRLLGNIGENNVALFHARTAGVDTLEAETFTVARFRRNIGRESSIGIIYTRRSTDNGESLFDPVQDRHTIGADLELNTSKFFGDKVLQFSAFFVGHNPSSPTDDSSDIMDRSSRGFRLNFPNQPWTGWVSYREFGEGYDPAVGFNRRNGFRRFQPAIRYSPLFEESNLIREIEWGIYFEHLMDLDYQLLTQNIRFTLGEVRFESGERIDLEITRNFELLDEDFDILRDGTVIVNPGEYSNWSVDSGFGTASFRKVSGSIGYETGGFWTGNKDEVRLRLTLRPIPGINLTAEYNRTKVSAEGSGFITNLVRTDLGFDFTPDISLSVNIQYDDVSELIGTNTRFRWILTPGSDIFLVYNHNWLDNMAYRMLTTQQGIALKAVYTYRF